MGCISCRRIRSHPLYIKVVDELIEDACRHYEYTPYEYPPAESGSLSLLVTTQLTGYRLTIRVKEPPDMNPATPEYEIPVNTKIVFCGEFKDAYGNPVVGGDIVVAEKDWLGRWAPIKNSAGAEIHTTTDSKGYWELTDDDGWPTSGTKIVWALGCLPGTRFDTFWQECR